MLRTRHRCNRCLDANVGPCRRLSDPPPVDLALAADRPLPPRPSRCVPARPPAGRVRGCRSPCSAAVVPIRCGPGVQRPTWWKRRVPAYCSTSAMRSCTQLLGHLTAAECRCGIHQLHGHPITCADGTAAVGLPVLFGVRRSLACVSRRPARWRVAGADVPRDLAYPPPQGTCCRTDPRHIPPPPLLDIVPFACETPAGCPFLPNAGCTRLAASVMCSPYRRQRADHACAAGRGADLLLPRPSSSTGAWRIHGLPVHAPSSECKPAPRAGPCC